MFWTVFKSRKNYSVGGYLSGTLAGIKNLPARLVALVHIFLVPFGLALEKIILLKIQYLRNNTSTPTTDSPYVTVIGKLSAHNGTAARLYVFFKHIF
jgi:hypothetical protein